MIKKHEQKLKHYKECLTRLPGQGGPNNNKAKEQARVIPTIPPNNLAEYSTLSVLDQQKISLLGRHPWDLSL